MASKKKAADLKSQVRALEALAGLTDLDETAARDVNGGAALASGPSIKPILPSPKLRKGTGAIAVRRGTGAIAAIGGTGALRIKGTGAVAIKVGGA